MPQESTAEQLNKLAASIESAARAASIAELTVGVKILAKRVAELEAETEKKKAELRAREQALAKKKARAGWERVVRRYVWFASLRSLLVR